MKKFVKPEFKILKNSNNYSKFCVEPLERGYSITLGNSLRRVLISSIYGPAIFGIKINGVTHEFDNIQGVKQNVSRIILNLKSLILKVNDKLFLKEEKIELSLSSKNSKKGVLKGSDIVCPTGIEVLNTDLEIINLEEDADLEMILYAKVSNGYKTSQENQEECKSISADIISIDSLFSPIRKVNFYFEDIKIGKNSDLERLILEVETNGSLSPHDAISTSSNILVGYLGLFEKLDGMFDLKNDLFENTEEDTKEEIEITDLGLSLRSTNCLKNNNINNIKDLTKLKEFDVKNFKNLGKKSFNEIKEKLANLNLNFNS